MNFERYAHYYDMLYADKDYHYEAETALSLIRKYESWGGTADKHILSIGCGTGKHDRELCHMGFKTHGIDLSKDMITCAKQMAEEEKLSATFEVADASTWRSEQIYDAVMSLFHVASYQTSNENLDGYMQAAASALQSGGIFLFDAWYGPGVLTDRPECRRKVVEDDECKVIRFATPTMHSNTNVVDVRYDLVVQSKMTKQIEEIEEVHHMRYFFQPEIRYMLADNGFEVLDVLDCNTLDQSGFDSWTVFFVARKK